MINDEEEDTSIQFGHLNPQKTVEQKSARFPIINNLDEVSSSSASSSDQKLTLSDDEDKPRADTLQVPIF